MKDNHIKITRTLALIPVFFFVSVLFTSCEKALEENPKSVTEETFYNTAQELETAVNAIYIRFRDNSFVQFETSLEIQSDFMLGRGSWAPLHGFQGLNDANITRVSGFWGDLYVVIRNANIVIKNAAAKNTISKADIDLYVSEAKFLRAFTYFQLVRAWGGVPLRTENNMFETDVKRSSVQEIYDFIIADLQEAEQKLPDIPKASGRPSKWAAKTVLSDVYLTLNKFPEARDKADEVIKSNRFSLVPVTSKADFQTKVFGPDLVSTTEEIFYMKYMRMQGQGNYMLWITNHPSTNLFNFGGAYVLYMASNSAYFTAWNNADLRKALWDKVNIGLGANTVISSKFTDTQAAGNAGAGNDDPVYGYNDVLLIYAEASARAAGAPTAQGMEAFNQVRRRAYGRSPIAVSTIDLKASDYTLSSFIDLVLEENGYEFMVGGKRWFDLVRTGKAAELVKARKNIVIAEKHYLWPIPVSETNYNKAIDPIKNQNPGY